MMTTMVMTEDMIREIFLWLPLKSVSRFKCLSKVWYARISDRRRRSSFRSIYLSGFQTRRETRIVGTDDDDDSPVFLGFLFQFKYNEKCTDTTYDRVRVVPPPTTHLQRNYNVFSMDLDPLGFLLRVANKKRKRERGDGPTRIFLAASCNGFLVCSLEKNYPVNYYLCNPITKEWLALPEPKNVSRHVVVGFVCQGGYPCIDLVQYTIVRATAEDPFMNCYNLPIEILSNGDDEWRQFTIMNSWNSPFILTEEPQAVVISTANDDVIMCCSVMTTAYNRRAILMFSIKNRMNTKATDDDESSHLQQQWMIEAPGSYNDFFYIIHSDYIEGFQGELHYSRFNVESEYIERWVINMDDMEWVCKNRLSLKMMIERSPWIESRQESSCLILGFHPINPNMMFLRTSSKKVWCNMESESLELAPHYVEHCFGSDNEYFSYQWPCWPPLL